ncbi:MAG TPA: flagellar basal body rod protein FlgC [Hyphomicrobiales bacterium]|nr:flagellar basal body rod protein FlgC [Rhodobiaceae bacterium]HXK54961.1 flagellar basal body rod protein FlgC [Hyphomicrobiales bacterium]
MDFLSTLKIAASGLRAQSGRMRVIAENLANADSTATTPQGEPYRRRVPTFVSELNREIGAQVVRPGRILTDRSDFKSRYEPGHPAADAKGYVKTPNVNPLIESMDMREAQRSYEANLNVVSSTRRMLMRTLDILKG